jgi:hypothetical protein
MWYKNHAPYGDRPVDHAVGPYFNKYRANKLLYKRAIDDNKRSESLMYNNDLHDLLLQKQRTIF